MENELKNIEEMQKLINELRKSKAELEESYRELQDSKNKLVQAEKLAFAGRMAASVAHEIRNPITVISMAIHQLHRSLKEDDPNRQYTDAIIKNTDRLNHLITEFVNCVRPPELRMKYKNINDILDSVINFVKVKTENQNIKVIKKFDKSLPLVKVDESHLERAFLNIILNAIESIQEEGNLTITTQKSYNSVIIKFEDTGNGISDEDIMRIFDPFFTTKEKGMGLGLSITYAIITSHDGTIDVESLADTKDRAHPLRGYPDEAGADKGTIFTVELPLRKKD